MMMQNKLITLKVFHEQGRNYIKLSDDLLIAVSRFNEKILKKEIIFEEVSCLCGKDEFSLIASIDRYGFIQKTVICTQCGLIQSSPRMTENAYHFFYESDEYRRLYDGVKFIDDYGKFYTDGQAESIYQTIFRHKNPREIASVLEFGAGGGWNLLPFIRHGFYVKGYDLSHKLVGLGREKGINLEQGTICNIEGSYDVIILNHVIEHFTNFLSDVIKIKAHLNKGGIIYIGVPNIEKFSMGHLQNAHTYYFTLKTLQFYVAKCGLKMIHNQPEIGQHISCIFVDEDPDIDDTFLEGHYEEMAKLLKNYNKFYYSKKIVIQALDTVGLTNIAQQIYHKFIKHV